MTKPKSGMRLKVKVANTTCGPYLIQGTTVTVVGVPRNGQFQTKEWQGSWFYLNEFETAEVTISELEKLIEEKSNEIKELQTKVEYLKETNQVDFDETQFKVYFTLKTLQTEGLTDLEKSKLVAELINS